MWLWRRYLSAGKLIEIQLKVQKLSKAVRLESLPGSFWAPGLIFCTLVSTGSDWNLWHVCWSLPASVVSNMWLWSQNPAQLIVFKCFCCLSPAFVLGFLFCFVFVVEVFAPCVFIGRQFLLLFLWLLLVFLVPCSHQAVLMVWLQTGRAYGDSKAYLISSSSSCFILIMLLSVCLSCFYFLSFVSPFVFLVHIPASQQT